MKIDIALFFLGSLISPYLGAVDGYPSEHRRKIAVIDTGVQLTPFLQPYLCKDHKHKDFSDTFIYDDSGHGTMVATLIAKEIDPKKNCLLILKWDSGHHTDQYGGSARKEEAALKYVEDNNIRYVNMSLSGSYPQPMEKALIREMTDKGVIFTVAAGNDYLDLDKHCGAYPACYGFKKNFYVVGNYIGNVKVRDSNYGSIVNAKEDGYNKCLDNFNMTNINTNEYKPMKICMTGTSLSSAVKMGKLVKELDHVRY